MRKLSIKTTSIAAGIVLATSLAGCATDGNPFDTKASAASTKSAAEGKCGEGKCGGDKSKKEGKCGGY